MTTRTSSLLSLAAALSLGAGCSDGSEAVPAVTILEVTPLAIDPALDTADDVTIRVEYRDADADLGGGIAEIHDCRAAALVTRLEIPAIATMEAIDANVPIEGTLTLVVADIGVAVHDTAPSETCADFGSATVPPAGETSFCVILVDASGHEGIGDCTPTVTIAGD